MKMVVPYQSTSGYKESDDQKLRPAGSRGGLVSRRVEMWEESKKQTAHRAPNPNENRSEVFDARQDQSSGKSGLSAVETTSYVGSDQVKKGIDRYNEEDYEQAELEFMTALKMQRVSFGGDHLTVALTLGNLGSVYIKQGKLDEAEKSLEQSLEIKRRLAPSMVVADTLNNLGSCASLKGDYEKSEQYYQQALKDLKQKDGKLADVASALFNIGRAEIQQRNWDRALRDLETSCDLTRKAYGVDHPFVAQTLDLIGYVHICTYNFNSSLVSFTSALAIYRKLYGPINLSVANSLLNIGMVRESKRELTDALEAYSTANDLFIRLKADPDHPGFMATRKSIAKMESAIARRNQRTLIEKHKKAREWANSRVL